MKTSYFPFKKLCWYIKQSTMVSSIKFSTRDWQIQVVFYINFPIWLTQNYMRKFKKFDSKHVFLLWQRRFLMDVGPHAQLAAVTRKIIWSVGNLIHQPKTGSVYFSEENVVSGMATNYFLMDWFYTKALTALCLTQKLLVLSGFLNQKFAGNLGKVGHI